MSFNRGGARTVMQHSYAHIPDNRIPRSTYMIHSGVKTTFDAGYLVPIRAIEVYPGDTFQVSTNGTARLATPITPYMDNMYFELHAHYCPLRLLWENFERFMGDRNPDPDSSIDYLIPQVASPNTGYVNGTIYDYMAYPTQVAAVFSASALPFRMYNKMYNQWYRDENLIDSVYETTGDGPDTYTNYVLQRRGKRKDYFTSLLPEPQKGDEVDIPFLGTAPITGLGKRTQTFTGGALNAYESDGTIHAYAQSAYVGTAADDQLIVKGNAATGGYPQIFADLSSASGASINDFRQAVTVQQLLEIDNRSGTRYVEQLKAHFNVISPDFRLQRVEFLGGNTAPVIVTPIAQTSQTDTTPLGNLAAIGTVGFGGRHLFTKSFVEHGIILIIATVRADLTYQQGLNRSWSRRTRYDFYYPTFANIGEMAVLNKELYLDGTAADEEVLGYQEPWGDLRTLPSVITGQFRSNYAQTLDIWHLSQYFTTRPTLNKTFIEEDPPVDRIKAVEGGESTTYPDFITDIVLDIKLTREIPLYGVPGLHKL